jgi:hypothetical protein
MTEAVAVARDSQAQTLSPFAEVVASLSAEHARSLSSTVDLASTKSSMTSLGKEVEALKRKAEADAAGMAS